MSETPRVGIVMGSDSDWPVMEEAAKALAEFGVAYESDVVSAHRMPEQMLAYGKDAAGRGLEVIIAGAGGAAHLPGMLASVTTLPVDRRPGPAQAPRRHGLAALHRADARGRAGRHGRRRQRPERRPAGGAHPRGVRRRAARAAGGVPGRAPRDRRDQGRVGPLTPARGSASSGSENRGDEGPPGRGRRRPLPRAARDGGHARARLARPRRQPDERAVAGRRPRVGAVRGPGRREPGADDRAADAGPRAGAGTTQPGPGDPRGAGRHHRAGARRARDRDRRDPDLLRRAVPDGAAVPRPHHQAAAGAGRGLGGRRPGRLAGRAAAPAGTPLRQPALRPARGSRPAAVRAAVHRLLPVRALARLRPPRHGAGPRGPEQPQAPGAGSPVPGWRPPSSRPPSPAG